MNQPHLLLTPHQQSIGTVSLIGAGPGDPELLTLRAAKRLSKAQVILFDNLVSSAVRALFPQHAIVHCVGKAKDKLSVSQDAINQLLLDYAQQGMNVCRVKGGDSFIFGRGSEEMLFLAEQGIPVEVIPGITAASGCSSANYLPLTHRGLAQGCTILTAHTEQDLDINWSALVHLDHTLVIYMGLSKSQQISQCLLQAGMSAEIPVAIIERGCTAQQQIYYGQLPELTTLKQQHQISSPALIIIGPVVNVAKKMQQLINQHAGAFQSQKPYAKPLLPNSEQDDVAAQLPLSLLA